MKKIKDLTVTVTYTVGLCDVEVDEKVFEALTAVAHRWGVHNGQLGQDEQVDAAFEWLADNIAEEDAGNWKYEINEMEE